MLIWSKNESLISLKLSVPHSLTKYEISSEVQSVFMFWVSKPCSRFDEPYWIYRYLQFKAKQHLWFVAICLLPCLHKRWVKEHSGAIKFSFCRPCNFTKTCIHMKLDPSCMQINKSTRQLFISFSFAVWQSRLSGNYCNSIFVAHNQLATFTYHSLRITTAATTIACQTYVAAISVCCMHLLHIFWGHWCHYLQRHRRCTVIDEVWQVMRCTLLRFKVFSGKCYFGLALVHKKVILNKITLCIGFFIVSAIIVK